MVKRTHQHIPFLQLRWRKRSTVPEDVRQRGSIKEPGWIAHCLRERQATGLDCQIEKHVIG